MKLNKFLITFICFVFLGSLLSAQVSTAQIHGKVTLEDGSGVPGVKVTARSPRMVGSSTATTDENGNFRLLGLTPGVFTITFELEGFQTVVRKNVRLEVEQNLAVNVEMKLSEIKETVTILGEVPLIDVKSQAQDMTLNRDIFQTLPKGRNFDALATIIPGVNDEYMLSGLSVDGASGAENMFYIDGVNTNDLVDGESAQNVSFDFVDEVQFKSGGYNAEFGGSMGGVINVITRSGGNEFHGEVLGFYSGTALEGTRRKRLDYDYSDKTQTTAKYYTYDEYVGKTDDYTIEGGVSLGGYIIKDKVWFFGSFMPKYYKRNRTIDYSIQEIDEVIEYERTRKWMNYHIKLTTQPFKNLRFGASFINNLYKYKGTDVLEAYSANPDSDYDSPGYSYPNYTASANADITVGNNLLVSLRGGYFYTNTTDPLIPPSDSPYYGFRMEQPYNYASTTNTMFPEIPAELQHPARWQSFTRSRVMALNKEVRKRYTVNADVTYFVNLGGEHSWKAGVQFVRQGEDVDDTAVQPIIYFGWDEDFVAYGTNYGRGKYGWYSARGNTDTGKYGDVYTAFSNRWAIYLQDSWTIGTKLTLNFGVRAESEYIPSYSDDPDFADLKPVEFPFSSKIAPRFGFVYDVYGDSSLKVYGSFGIFQDVMKLYMAANAFGGFKWKSAYYTLDDYDYTKIGVNGNYPGTLLKVFDFRPPSFDSVDPDMKPFSQQEISFGVERKFSENIAGHLRIVSKRILWGIEDVGIMLPDGEYYYYCNPGSDFVNDKYNESKAAGIMPQGALPSLKAKRNYFAVSLSFEKRLSDNWMGGISYTYSNLEGNYSGLASSDEDGRNDPNGERAFDMWYLSYDKSLSPIDGVLPTDRPHSIKAYGSYVFPFGLTLGGVLNAMSGTPVTQEWTVDSPSYYPYNRGNLGRTPFLWYVNLYAEYNIKLGKATLNLNFNVDNVFNADTAQKIWQEQYDTNVSPGEDKLVDDPGWIPTEVVQNLVEDPRYKKEWRFYPPLNARIGIRLMF